MTMLVKPAIEIALVSPADYDNLAEYLASFPEERRGPCHWKNRFLLWWDKNPAFSSDKERGWLITEKQRIVGFMGSIPTFFQCQGEEIVAQNATTWRVLPDYRKHSLNLLFRLLAASRHSILFDTTPTPPVVEMLKALGFRPFPREDERYSLMIVNRGHMLRSLMKRASVPAWLAGLASPFSGLLPMPSSRCFANGKSFQVKPLDEADSSFDRLWEERRHVYPNTGVRTARVINWYCFANKDHEKLLFACFKNRELKASMILAEGEGGKYRRLRCLDLWGDLEASGVLEALLGGVWEYARDQAYDLVTFPHFSVPLGKKLRLFPFICRKDRERCQYFKAGDDRDPSIDKENSYLTDFHGDVGL